MKEWLHKLKPRIYVCRDVYVIYWLDYEFTIPRLLL